MAGELDDVVAGEIVEASWGNSVRDRVVSFFATTTARDAAYTTPTAGQLCYVASLGRLQVYLNSAWHDVLTSRGGTILNGGAGGTEALTFQDAAATDRWRIWVDNSDIWRLHDIDNAEDLVTVADDQIFIAGNHSGGGMYFKGIDGSVSDRVQLSGVPLIVGADDGTTHEPWAASNILTDVGAFGTQGNYSQWMTYNWFRAASGYRGRSAYTNGSIYASAIELIDDQIRFRIAGIGTLPPTTLCFIDYQGYTDNGGESIRNIIMSTSAPSGGDNGDVWLQFAT